MEMALLSDIATEALMLVLVLSLPILAAVLFSSLIVGWFNAYTKMNEPAIGFSIRALTVIGCLLVVSPWIAQRASQFASKTWQLFQSFVS